MYSLWNFQDTLFLEGIWLSARDLVFLACYPLPQCDGLGLFSWWLPERAGARAEKCHVTPSVIFCGPE